MPTNQSILDLIDQCDFNEENPFELSENLFPILNQITSPTITKLFEKTCYNGWLIFGFNGENEVSVIYDTIRERLNNGYLEKYFNHLSDQEFNAIKESFSEIIEDEVKHSKMFAIIIDKLGLKENYRPDFYTPNCEEFVKLQNDYWQNNSLFERLTNIVTGESYLLATFVLFYRYSSNPIKQEIFKEFIKDESKHVAHFMNFMKKAQITDEDRQLFRPKFLEYARSRSKFESLKFDNFLDKLMVDSNKKNLILKTAYKTEFHRTFRKIFLKKTWQFYNIVFPDVDQDMYEDLLYKKQPLT